MEVDLDVIIRWILIFSGLYLINIFPKNINNEWNGLILSMGIIFFVYGAIWNIKR